MNIIYQIQDYINKYKSSSLQKNSLLLNLNLAKDYTNSTRLVGSLAKCQNRDIN